MDLPADTGRAMLMVPHPMCSWGYPVFCMTPFRLHLLQQDIFWCEPDSGAFIAALLLGASVEEFVAHKLFSR